MLPGWWIYSLAILKNACSELAAPCEKLLAVYHNFVFCAMLVQSVFPDLGYFEHSWQEFLNGLDQYRAVNQMIFCPTRAELLEIGSGLDLKDWPNTEHRIAKPWHTMYSGEL